MSTTAKKWPMVKPLTAELYRDIVEDLLTLNTVHRNPWARSWLEILGTVPDPEARPAVLAALIRGLPALYKDFEALSLAAAKRVLEEPYDKLAVLNRDISLLDELKVPPKPDSVPDNLGELFAPLAGPSPDNVKLDEVLEEE